MAEPIVTNYEYEQRQLELTKQVTTVGFEPTDPRCTAIEQYANTIDELKTTDDEPKALKLKRIELTNRKAALGSSASSEEVDVITKAENYARSSCRALCDTAQRRFPREVRDLIYNSIEKAQRCVMEQGDVLRQKPGWWMHSGYNGGWSVASLGHWWRYFICR